MGSRQIIEKCHRYYRYRRHFKLKYRYRIDLKNWYRPSLFTARQRGCFLCSLKIKIQYAS